jgi:Family of unknown function (DUF6232)
MTTRTYYRGPDAVVTDQLFVWLTQPTKSYVVRDLRNVGLVRTQASRPYAAYLAGAALVLGAASWTMFDSPVRYALSGLAVAVLSAFALVSVRTGLRRWELHASYRGTRVVLYASSDVRVFNQVVRALRRAIEDARPPTGDYGLAAA